MIFFDHCTQWAVIKIKLNVNKTDGCAVIINNGYSGLRWNGPQIGALILGTSCTCGYYPLGNSSSLRMEKVAAKHLHPSFAILFLLLAIGIAPNAPLHHCSRELVHHIAGAPYLTSLQWHMLWQHNLPFCEWHQHTLPVWVFAPVHTPLNPQPFMYFA